MNKKLLIASLIALGIGFQVSAQTTNVVYLTGSTAFRGNVYKLMTNTTSAGVFDAASGANRVFASRGNADPSKANFIEYIGQRSGTWTIANCAWSGSEAGIASVANETVLNSDGHPLV